ncbi:hypothetical protein [Streptacidiphilus fuscans]|uniref:hypothetical protein n=1 Tax=Streptacidiphilus fuscans TaxID=2789292 RepID=UPI001C06EEB3|nr:hypothetical protein [Streptacidiphilus fuscans]
MPASTWDMESFGGADGGEVADTAGTEEPADADEPDDAAPDDVLDEPPDDVPDEPPGDVPDAAPEDGEELPEELAEDIDSEHPVTPRTTATAQLTTPAAFHRMAPPPCSAPPCPDPCPVGGPGTLVRKVGTGFS